jgi:hypothetical protein
MAKKEKQEKRAGIWRRLFPGFGVDGQDEAGLSPPSGGPVAPPLGDAISDAVTVDAQGNVVATEGEPYKAINQLPLDRITKYLDLERMATDPTIDSAIKMHITHALSARADTGEIISIESTSDKDDPITIDLRNTFKEQLNHNCHNWAYNAAVYGMWPVRIYGEQGHGVTMIRSDYYTHPRTLKKYEKNGQLVGYLSAYQDLGNIKNRMTRLMEPWKWVEFRIPFWPVFSWMEPVVEAQGQIPIDIANDDLEQAPIVESQSYGSSLIETAYGPWLDLLEAILSLNMSRKNASRLERLIGVNTGKLSPKRAAEYLNSVSSQLLKTNQKNMNRLLRRGFVQTVVNHLIPIWGDGKGRLEISTVEGSPNIDGLADIDFHVKRLGSALGIDPALLGFGEMLSGGLGDGGFFRLSIMAAIKGQLLRRAMVTGFDRLFDIHIAYKYGKVFLPGERPWRIIFNAVSSAMEREEAENNDARVNFATMLGTMLQVVDPEFTHIDRPALHNFIWTDILKVDEEKFKAIFPAKKAKAAGPEGGGAEESQGNDDVMESAIRDCMHQIYGR